MVRFTRADVMNMDEAEFFSYVGIVSGSSKSKTYLVRPPKKRK
jgi:hypothetical protein